MNRTLDVHPLKSRIGDFVAGLKELEREAFTPPQVSSYVSQMQPPTDALASYVLWDRERYTRNLIYRDEFFEVLVLCWLPGQRTPIHSHNGQLGWVTVVQGELVCRNYRFVRPEKLGRALVPSSDNTSGARPVEVELLHSANCQADGSVAVVDRRQTTHQIENLEKSSLGSISLHVYSKPIDSCVLFDEASRCCLRTPLQYHSTDGVILGNPLPAHQPATTTAA